MLLFVGSYTRQWKGVGVVGMEWPVEKFAASDAT